MPAEARYEWLTQAEVARRLGRNRSTIGRWVKAGSLTHIVEGGQVYIHRDVVQRMLEEREAARHG